MYDVYNYAHYINHHLYGHEYTGNEYLGSEELTYFTSIKFFSHIRY